MPIFARFGVRNLEWQVCILCIPERIRKQHMVGLHGVAPHDIGTLQVPSTF